MPSTAAMPVLASSAEPLRKGGLLRSWRTFRQRLDMAAYPLQPVSRPADDGVALGQDAFAQVDEGHGGAFDGFGEHADRGVPGDGEARDGEHVVPVGGDRVVHRAGGEVARLAHLAAD